MTAQHNRSLLLQADGAHTEIPRPVPKRIRDITDHLTRESLITSLIHKAESDTILSMRDDRPVPPIPTIWSAVQGIYAFWVVWGRVLVGQDVVAGAVDGEGRVLDAIGVAAGYTTEMRMLLVDAVVGGVVPAGDDIAFDAGGIVQEEIGD